MISCSQDAKAYEFYDSYSYPVTTSYVTPSKEIVVDNTEEFDVKAEDIEYVDVEFADLVISEPEPVVESEPQYSEETIIANTKGEGEKAGEDFWVSATRSLAVRSQRTNNKYRCLDNW